MSKGWAIFLYLFAPIFIGLFGWVLTLPFKNGNFSPNVNWILIPISIAMITLMVAAVIDAYKGRLIIYEDRIISISAFSNRELKFDEIKGYIVGEKYISIKPNDKTKKKITVSKYMGGYSEILFWLSQTFTDLEKQTAIEEEQEILNDVQYGWAKDVRGEKLAKARQISKIINWAAGITAAWAFFYPTPYQYSILAAMAVPIVALLAVKFSNGLIRVDEKKGSAYPSVIYAFIFPSCALALRAILDYNIFDYSNVWLSTTLIALSFLALLLINQKEITYKKMLDYLTVISLALLLFAYSFGVLIHFNCYYDNSETQYFNAKVLNKRISSGKVTTYYLKLSTWGQQKEADEVTVDEELYDRVEVGNEVNIYLKKGAFDIPWLIVTDE